MFLQSSHGDASRKCILVVDDDGDVREAIDLVLSPTYEVRFAVDGLDGCERANDQPVPDLIIADVSMPFLDGFTMVQRIRVNLALRSVPVIFFTGQTLAASVIAGLPVGTCTYVSKTSAPGILQARVRRALEH
jgi:PleD family two-component response regulator